MKNISFFGKNYYFILIKLLKVWIFPKIKIRFDLKKLLSYFYLLNNYTNV